jgi:hypothetical protein
MRRLLLTSLALAAVAVPLRAQNPNCAVAPATTADACEKATDLWSYMMPQLGTSLVGGSHTLGIGSSLGGFGHFAIALRANAVMGDLPDVAGMSVSAVGRQQGNIGTSSQILGLPAVDFSLGIWKGYPIGVSRIGGLDLIGSLTYIPEIEDTDAGVALRPDGGSTKVGLGARIGLLEQSLIVPGVAFSYLVRDLPTMNLEATSPDAEFAISDFSVKTKSWRLALQKNLLLFQLGAGVGQDTYDSRADISATVNTVGNPSVNTSVDQSLTRTTYYGSLGFNLFLAKVVAEVGQVNGGTVTTYNSFDEAADKSRLYGSVGIRISF